MAAVQILKFTGGVNSDNKKWNNISVKTSKTFTELEGKLTHNFISQMEIFTERYAEKFRFIFKGKFTKAIGDGIRFIETFGTLHVKEHTPPKSGDKLCLQVPYDIDDRSEVLKNYFRLKCSAKAPDIMASSDIWVSPIEMYEFQKKKVGDAQRSLELYVYLMWHYVLMCDPWAKEHADNLLTWSVACRLAAKWEDNEFVGEALNLIKTKIQQEYDKEKNLKNVVNYSVKEWLPRKLTPAQKNSLKRKQKPTAEIDKTKLAKLYFTNSEVEPVDYVCAIARAIEFHAQRMFTFTAENASTFPGNNQEELKNVGKDKANFQYMCTCAPEDLVIIMNNELYLTLKEFDGISDRTDVGAFIGFVSKIFKHTVIPLEGMPYGCIKIGSKYRYNHWLLYDKILTDTMGYEDFRMWTVHQGMLVGIREFVPFCCLRISELYMNPAVAEKVEVKPAEEAL